ncbi:hypothetical protein L596_025831 [Steinernema carpocapsae]|uniref:Nematode cuticle collagen N-terminal domain-containing protein n=1 Tax=Steinernema carpocapsae TaxID=34508 RepID=A0A4U5M8Y5_STECR|nr:hypothetical protein L596_025831 [Steinernema carpocapsae]
MRFGLLEALTVFLVFAAAPLQAANANESFPVALPFNFNKKFFAAGDVAERLPIREADLIWPDECSAIEEAPVPEQKTEEKPKEKIVIARMILNRLRAVRNVFSRAIRSVPRPFLGGFVAGFSTVIIFNMAVFLVLAAELDEAIFNALMEEEELIEKEVAAAIIRLEGIPEDNEAEC